MSRRDFVGGKTVTTFDVRMKSPNAEPAVHPGAMHTIEHIVATYLRASEYAGQVIYWGPMGCLTGCYFIVADDHATEPREVEKLLRRAFKALADWQGPVPGAEPKNCGNALLHDLPMAKWEARRFLKAKWRTAYPR